MQLVKETQSKAPLFVPVSAPGLEVNLQPPTELHNLDQGFGADQKVCSVSQYEYAKGKYHTQVDIHAEVLKLIGAKMDGLFKKVHPLKVNSHINGSAAFLSITLGNPAHNNTRNVNYNHAAPLPHHIRIPCNRIDIQPGKHRKTFVSGEIYDNGLLLSMPYGMRVGPSEEEVIAHTSDDELLNDLKNRINELKGRNIQITGCKDGRLEISRLSTEIL